MCIRDRVPDDEDAQIWFKGYNLLTAKPTIYAANVAEDDLVIRHLKRSCHHADVYKRQV